MALDWTKDSWRVIGPECWPRLSKPRPGERAVVLPPEKPPPACAHCGQPCHLMDDDRHPVHKTCAEAAMDEGDVS